MTAWNSPVGRHLPFCSKPNSGFAIHNQMRPYHFYPQNSPNLAIFSTFKIAISPYEHYLEQRNLVQMCIYSVPSLSQTDFEYRAKLWCPGCRIWQILTFFESLQKIAKITKKEWSLKKKNLNTF